MRVPGYPKFRLSADERNELLVDSPPYAKLFHPNAAVLTEPPACCDPNDVEIDRVRLD